MQTYIFGNEQVEFYLRDLVERLDEINDKPDHWFTLGVSGDKIGKALVLLSSAKKIQPAKFSRLAYDRKQKLMLMRDEPNIPDLKGKTVFLIDAAVHSGTSMKYAAKALFEAGADSVISYSLVVKKTSEFIPNWFGLLIDEHDRAFFQLDAIPNNRLRKSEPFGILRALDETDVDHPNIACGEAAIDRISYGDLWYYMRTQNSKAFVYEIKGQIKAFVHFKITAAGALFVDLIARDKSVDKQRLGGILMRWIETYARANRCAGIELWSVANQVHHYKRFGFEIIEFVPKMNTGNSEELTKMSKRILYNIKPVELLSEA